MLFGYCFVDWKIGVFQQIVRVYCILKDQVHSQKEGLKRQAMAVSDGKGTLLSL